MSTSAAYRARIAELEKECEMLSELAHTLNAQGVEDAAEIARHHELIAWLRESLIWALSYVESEYSTPNRDHPVYLRVQEIWQRLNREVG